MTYTYLLVAALADQPVPLLGEFPDGVVDRRRDGRAVQQLAVVSELGQLRAVSEELPTERLQTNRRLSTSCTVIANVLSGVDLS